MTNLKGVKIKTYTSTLIKVLPIWTSMAAEDLSVVGSLMSRARSPLVNSRPRYSRLSSGERMMSLTTLFTAGSVILRGKDDTSLQTSTHVSSQSHEECSDVNQHALITSRVYSRNQVGRQPTLLVVMTNTMTSIYLMLL